MGVSFLGFSATIASVVIKRPGSVTRDNHHQPILASGTSTGRRDSRALALGARGGLYAKAFEGTTVRRPFPAERISQDT